METLHISDKSFSYPDFAPLLSAPVRIQIDKKSKQYVRGVSCPHCYNVKSSSQKEKYANRQKQVDIANATGKTHFGNATKVIG